MSENNEVQDLIVLGKNLGIYTDGWDQADDFGIIFMSPSFNSLGHQIFGVEACGSVFINFDTGEWSIYEEDDEIGKGNDFADRLADAIMLERALHAINEPIAHTTEELDDASD